MGGSRVQGGRVSGGWLGDTFGGHICGGEVSLMSFLCLPSAQASLWQVCGKFDGILLSQLEC